VLYNHSVQHIARNTAKNVHAWCTAQSTDTSHLTNAVQTFLYALEPSDLASFLGLKTTVGSLLRRFDECQTPEKVTTALAFGQAILPPSLLECITTFTTVHQRKPHPNANQRRKLPPNRLTVGAKALAKHAHRDTKDCFWGVATGSKYILGKYEVCSLIMCHTCCSRRPEKPYSK
jgi:hypothetical protein